MYWSSFVARFFSPAGVFRHSLHIGDGEDLLEKQYEIPYPAIARYFHTYFSSGVKSMQLILDKFGTDRYLPGDYYCIENYRASLTYWYESGSHVSAEFPCQPRAAFANWPCSGGCYGLLASTVRCRASARAAGVFRDKPRRVHCPKTGH